eukprot:Gregarina_sp_Poly_1__3413@NODE_198_length_11566_cov_244_091399_g177_i0_p5_GENE_NODE_198_length_11566_cov_244_091399_g177_i0NODE_198_length_11566_cov_244_091399_g177_i0_p5_ORF_typecomplete_len468_score49_80PUB/PF09409_10/4_4e11UBX/PF00789_20/1_1e04UBX/PF00789_20/1_5e03UBX/PF00789_20/0_27Med1/PF10744_9/0_079FERM_f0/PF16511_5/0_18CAGE1/PF15066_6/0_17Rad60SLD_2/PF13881_6/0_33_NODE_198_length_11566_cov_244_091399_g177_i079579360
MCRKIRIYGDSNAMPPSRLGTCTFFLPAMSEKDQVTSLLIEVGIELGRSEQEIHALVTKLVEEEWLDTFSALKTLSEEDWTNLKLPRRFFLKLKEKLEQVSETIEEVKPLTAVDLEPPDGREPWTEILLAEEISQFISSREFSKDHKTEALRCLYRIVNAILDVPDDPSKRRIRRKNPNFEARIGNKEPCMKILKGVGFVIELEENNRVTEEYLKLPVAYLSRLTDCCHLLAMAIRDLGAVVPESRVVRSSGFNPYRTNLVTSRPDAQNLGGIGSLESDPSYLSAQIRKEHQLRSTGGVSVTEPLPLNKIVYNSMREIPQSPSPQVTDTQNEGIPLSAADLNRIKESISGNRQFKSMAKERLELLKREPVYSKVCLRIIGTDNAVLQMEFRPNTLVADVCKTIWNHGLSTMMRDLIGSSNGFYLVEAPNKILDPSKTLYQQSLVPNATVRLKLKKNAFALQSVKNFS